MLKNDTRNASPVPCEQRLCHVNRRAVYRIISVHLSRREADDLEALGIAPGEYLEPVFNDFKGTLAVWAGDQQVILGRRITYKLVVVQSSRHTAHSAVSD